MRVDVCVRADSPTVALTRGQYRDRGPNGQYQNSDGPVLSDRAVVNNQTQPPEVLGRVFNKRLAYWQQPAGSQAFGASQGAGSRHTGTGQHTCTGTCRQTTRGTHRVAV